MQSLVHEHTGHALCGKWTADTSNSIDALDQERLRQLLPLRLQPGAGETDWLADIYRNNDLVASPNHF